ncbi:MAG: metal ABC transporter ATP-binding protein [Planctomycetia bacterium]|nr:metal ABC transporter ATP-binding protein [Planctomycetia bacterium]
MIPAIEVHDLTVAYREKPALWDVDLAVPTGSLMAIVGPNGAGKTTLLKSILGLIPAVAGNVFIHGEPFHSGRRRVAYVPQKSSVDWDFPTTVFDLVRMGTYGRLGWFRRPGAAERDATATALRRVGLGDLGDRQIGQLSGGQQQRAFLARALVQDADVYALDEPLQGVDAVTERAVMDILRDLRNAGKTIVAVHHDLHTVPAYFDSVTFLNVKVIASGPVGHAFTPENLKLAYGDAARA